jgi:hypothetical protein
VSLLRSFKVQKKIFRFIAPNLRIFIRFAVLIDEFSPQTNVRTATTDYFLMIAASHWSRGAIHQRSVN